MAVIPVILFHAGFELFSGGYVGVDVFFVISGYLITTILIEDLENKRFSIVTFYERRARRIVPALSFVMLCCIPFAWMWMLPHQLKDFSQSFIAVTLFASNFLFWLESDYFDSASEEKPLLHTWSLAVEEQYYVLFPIFLFLCWKMGRKETFWIIVAIAGASFLLSEWSSKNHPSANFYLAPTRAWELFAGSITAFIVHKHGIRANNLVSAIGLAAIVFAILVYDENTPFPGSYALLPVAGVVLIILCADQHSFAAIVLRNRLFVGIGLISYSAYLWHQPLFAFARIRSIDLPGPALMGLLSVLSLVLAALSYQYVEQPFRNKQRCSRPFIFTTSAAVAMVCLVVGATGYLNQGFTHRFSQEEFANWEDTSSCTLQGVRTSSQLEDITARCFPPAVKTRFLLIGDSHAETLSKPLRRVIEENNGGLITLIDKGCLPIRGTSRHPLQKNCIFAKNLFWRLANQTNATVILSARWRLYMDGARYDNEEGGVEYGENWINHVIDDGTDDIYKHTYNELLSQANNQRLIILSQIPETGWKVPEVVAKYQKYKDIPNATITTSYKVYLEKNRRINQWLEALGSHNAIDVLRTEDIVCTEQTMRCSNAYLGRSFYRDDNHPSPSYAAKIAQQFHDEILQDDQAITAL